MLEEQELMEFELVIYLFDRQELQHFYSEVI